jgi:hypothetical protein
MSLTTRTTLVLFALGAGIAWLFGGREGAGVMAGFLCGAAIAGITLAVQRKIALERPRFLLHAVFAGFLIKAFAVLSLTLLVAFVPGVNAAVHPVAFLLAFAATAILILLPATLDTLRLLSPTRAVVARIRELEAAKARGSTP